MFTIVKEELCDKKILSDTLLINEGFQKFQQRM